MIASTHEDSEESPVVRGSQTREEYLRHVGWGHSAIHDALAFARLAGVKHLLPFHHDPGRDDAALEAAISTAIADMNPNFPVTPAAEGGNLRGRPTSFLTMVTASKRAIDPLASLSREWRNQPCAIRD
jgi:hypothetical protein